MRRNYAQRRRQRSIYAEVIYCSINYVQVLLKPAMTQKRLGHMNGGVVPFSTMFKNR